MKQNTQTNNLFLRITGLFVILLVVASVTGLTLPRVFTAQAVTPPNIISYQGRILNSNSVPVADANATMIFELYDASAGGTCLWSNSSATCATATGKVITLTDGLFSENLGDTGDSYAAIADSVFADNGGVYLQVTIGGETLTPRKQISAAPYALNADTLDGIDSTGLMLSSGDTATGSYDFTGAELLGASPLQFEGVTNDNVYTTFAFTDPTVARTITFKDESGTVALLSDVGGTSLFTDGGTTTYLTSATDDFAIGGTAPASSPFGIDESANTVYIGEGSTANGKIVFKASDADTGTLTYNTSDTFAFTGGNISSDGTITASDFSCTDCLNFSDFANAMSLDGATWITGEAGEQFQLLRTLTNATTEHAMLINVTASDTTSSTEDQSGLVIQNVNSTEGLDEAIRIYNADTDDAIATGIMIESTTGGITTGINLSDTDIVTALDLNSNPILYDGIRVAELSTGILTWEDTSGNDLMTLTDNGTTGNLAFTGRLVSPSHANNQGFLLPTNAGSPSAVTGTAEGDIVWDSTGDALYVYTGSSFAEVGGSPSLFTDGGTTTYLTSATDDFAIGGTSPASSPFGVDESANTVYIGEGSTANGNIVFKASDADTGTLTYNTSDTFAFTGGAISSDSTITASDFVCTDCLNFSDFANAMSLDGATWITGEAGESFQLLRTLTNATTEYAMLINVTASDTTSSTLDQRGLVIQNAASTEGLDEAIWIYNADTDDAIANGITIESTTGGITTGVNLSDTDIVTALDLNSNPILYDGIRVAELSTGILTWEDTSGNDLMTLTDNGTTGTLDVTGDLTCVDCFDFSDFADSMTLDASTSIGGGNSLALTISSDLSGGARSTDLFVISQANDVTNNSTGDLFQITQSDTASTGKAFYIQNDGAGTGIHIEQDGDTGALVPSLTSTAALHVNNAANDGMGLSVYTFMGSLANAPLAYLFSDAALFDEEVLYVEQDGVASALHIEMNGDTASTTPAPTSAAALHINNDTNNGMGLSLYSNNGATANAPLAYLLSDNTAFDEEVLYIQQDGSAAGLYIDNNGTGRGLNIQNASTDYGMLLNQTANGTAQYISSLSTTSDVVAIVANNITSGNALYISGGGSTTTGNLLSLSSGAGGTGDVASITNAGTGAGVFIDQNGVTDDIIPAGGAEAGLAIDNNGNTGMALSVYTNTGATVNAPLAYILADNSAFDQEVLKIQNDGTGAGLYINQDGNGEALKVDSIATSSDVIAVNGSASTIGDVIQAISTSAALSSGDLFHGYTDGTHTSIGEVSGNLIDISRQNTNNSGGLLTLSGALVNIQNAPTNTSGTLTDSQDLIFLDQNNTTSTGTIIEIDSESATSVSIGINTLSTAADVFDITASALTSGTVLDIDATNGSMTGDVIEISNSGTGAGIFIAQNGDTNDTIPGAGTEAALHITNTSNDGLGFSLFSNNGATANAPLAYLLSNNTAFDEEVLYIQQNGSGAGVYIDSNGTGAVAINIDSEATTANVATFDGSVLTTGNILELIGGNFTDDSGMALSIDVTESTETADILNIQTNFSTSNNNVFRIEADGEAFSDVGFTAGAFSTNYYDASITSTGAFTYASPTSFTWTDDAANTLMTLTDSGTTGTLDVTGDLTCTDCFDWTDWVDGTSTLDATTSTQLGTNNYNFLVNDTGDVNVVLQSSGGIFTVRDGAIEYLTFNNAQEVDYIGDGTTGDAWDFASSTLTTGSMFDIDATNASMGGDVIRILNAGTGSSIFIDADGNTGAGVNNAALTVDNSGNTDYGLTVISTNTTTAYPLVRFVMDSGSANEEALYVQNDGTASGVYVDQNGNTGATVTNAALAVENSGNTGFGLTVYSSQATSSESLVQFEATANFDDDVLTITNAATNAASSALYIDATGAAGSGAAAIDIDADVGAFALDILNAGSDSDTRKGIRIQTGRNTNPGATSDFILFVDGDGTTLGAVEGDGAGGVTTASAGSDYAELFPGNYAAFSTGDVVALDSAGNSVLASSSRQMIGAYSIAPNTLGNWFDEWQVAGTHVPVALLGQVPVNVNMEGGPIAVGDHLAISSVNGVATKATGVGYVLGTALESTSANGQIMVFVQPKWHALDIFVDNGDTTLVSEGLVLGQAATATAGSTGESSNALSLKGSAWTGASAVGREMFVQNDVTDSSNYKLSVKNDDGVEVAFINNEGDLSLSGKLYPSDRGIAQTDKYIFYDGSTGFGGDFMRTNASGWGSGSYDFAEMFPSRDSLVAGELVVFAEGSAEVGRSTSRHYDPKIAGIISTQPGFLAGDNIEGHVPVALTGRVPTYVTTENGAIQSGDPLTTSSRPGYAMKATTEGQIVGYAMEGFSGNTGVITVFVRPSYYDGSTITDAPAADNTVSGLQGSISDFDVTGVLNMNGGSIINVASLSGISGIWELRHDGEFRTKGRFVHLIASSQGELVETYPTLSTQTTIELTGTAQLTNGRARIIFEDIDPMFNDIISPVAPYRVFLTADSPTNPIYAIERDNLGFVIRETNGSSNATIDWMVIAYHKDFTPLEDTSIQGQDTGVTEPANEPPATEEPVADPVVDPDPVVVEDPVEEIIVEPVVEEPTVETVPETTTEPEVVVTEDPLPEPVVEEPVTEEPAAEPVPESTDETAV